MTLNLASRSVLRPGPVRNIALRSRPRYVRFVSEDVRPSSQTERPSDSTVADDKSSNSSLQLPSLQVDRETKTVSTAGGELPISPLMDPSFHEARQKFKKAKKHESPVHEKIRWRRILMRNPYAQALASPIRTCPVSRTSLPRDFLQRFNLVRHPKSGDPWWVPADLDSTRQSQSPSPSSSSELEGNEGSETLEQHDHEAAAVAAAIATEPSKDKAPESHSTKPPAPPVPRGPSAYVLARQDLLDAFRGKRTSTPYARGEKRVSISGAPRWTGVVGRAVWREDMSTFLLELMRRRAVDQLVELARRTAGDGNGVDAGKKGQGYIILCETWDDASQYTHRGCLLWLGSSGRKGEEGVEQDGGGAKAAEEGGNEPSRLSAITIEGKRYGAKLVAHNLRVLLGGEHVSQLREESALLRDGPLFLLRGQASIKLQLLLWKLQGYMA